MKRILVVDDDRDVFESMKIVLEAEGYAVDWATKLWRRHARRGRIS
jgi:DNA-binding response OmpR family regulator